MPILNYTTSVNTEKSIQQIERMLAAAGCNAVMKEYDPRGGVAAIAFRVSHQGQLISFRLPANHDKVLEVLRRECTPKWRTHEHAKRVAWRIIKDWLEAQLALLKTEQVTMLQVMLPFAQTSRGTTVYEELEKTNFLQLTGPS
jgi:hypothetical protein